MPVQMLKGFRGNGPQVMLNNSIESLEYEFANAIKKITAKNQAVIAFIEGHGELDKFETADITRSLREFYDLEKVVIDQKINSLTSRTYADSTTTYAINNYTMRL